MATERALFICKTDIIDQHVDKITCGLETVPDGVGFCKKQYDPSLPTQYVDVVSPCMGDLKILAETSTLFEHVCDVDFAPPILGGMIGLPLAASGNRRLFLAGIGITALSLLIPMQAHGIVLTAARRTRIRQFLRDRGWTVAQLANLTDKFTNITNLTDRQAGYLVALLHKWPLRLIREYTKEEA
jgi:hypothetical protein